MMRIKLGGQCGHVGSDGVAQFGNMISNVIGPWNGDALLGNHSPHDEDFSLVSGDF